MSNRLWIGYSAYGTYSLSGGLLFGVQGVCGQRRQQWRELHFHAVGGRQRGVRLADDRQRRAGNVHAQRRQPVLRARRVVRRLRPGALVQTGGTNTAAGGLYLAVNTGSSGAYNLNGGSLLSGNGAYVGDSGPGTSRNRAGPIPSPAVCTSDTTPAVAGPIASAAAACSPQTASTSAWLPAAPAASRSRAGPMPCPALCTSAYNSGSSGTYSLSGSGLLSAQSEYMGTSGTGNFHAIRRHEFHDESLFYPAQADVYSLSGSGLLSASFRADSGRGVPLPADRRDQHGRICQALNRRPLSAQRRPAPAWHRPANGRRDLGRRRRFGGDLAGSSTIVDLSGSVVNTRVHVAWPSAPIPC